MKPLFYFLIMIYAAVFATGCNSANDAPEAQAPVKDSATGITQQPFGNYFAAPVTEYTIVNKSGMKLSVLDYGATVSKLFVPDRNGKTGDVVLGFESFSGYLQKDDPYIGATVGRYANRIANGSFRLNGKTYQLKKNDGENTLHGGMLGFDKVMWTVEKIGDSSLRLKYKSRDGEEGYPGNLEVQLIYTLTADNAVRLDYSATTDQPTPVNLSNHSYFNLSAGMDTTILNHQLELNADRYTVVNKSLIPTGKLEEVKNTPMDFTKAKRIGQDIALIPGVPGGFDHNWVLNKTGEGMVRAAALYDSASGRYMEVFTTEPGIQFYSGNFLNGKLGVTKNALPYVRNAGLCLETQHFPDSPNQPSFPNTILKPGETYRQTTVYKFSVK